MCFEPGFGSKQGIVHLRRRTLPFLCLASVYRRADVGKQSIEKHYAEQDSFGLEHCSSVSV